MTEIPEGIPQDVWQAAMAVSPTGAGHVMQLAFAEVASRAILAERERCAKIADEHVRAKVAMSGPGGASLMAKSIAYAIRTPA